ncbi:hypothetical protein C499_08592 [Halogeometricum borinquense DSM 11551]|uniref:Uncharacterized protein n=2 Tax=Halogeometricum borinquense TaxID=60847 RepID=E4NMH0_HALBP|nr:hypothetical protein [Halogeometricum borinquense]ADQ68468.1 hypothetical protein Hbor_29290 [Halogeometricum borinquense DSM 11551]ELY27888.1 hypothetical protein C499_08592 [Halogeometricum borinquense DSM 11551]RYJ14999.1 hypothetical protein ELS19_14265 [Halogeometricum borinquense]
MPKTLTTIELEDDVDRWRYVCPRGHRDWEPTNNHFWCAACARTYHDDIDPEFQELRDRRDGEPLSRDEVRLMTPAGPYREVYKGGGHA